MPASTENLPLYSPEPSNTYRPDGISNWWVILLFVLVFGTGSVILYENLKLQIYGTDATWTLATKFQASQRDAADCPKEKGVPCNAPQIHLLIPENFPQDIGKGQALYLVATNEFGASILLPGVILAIHPETNRAIGKINYSRPTYAIFALKERFVEAAAMANKQPNFHVRVWAIPKYMTDWSYGTLRRIVTLFAL